MANAAWLTSYRNGRSGAKPSGLPGKPTPRAPLFLVPKGGPARPPVSSFANDNFRPSSGGRIPFAPILRRLPYLGIALTAYEVWEAYNQYTTDDGLHGVWTKKGNCSSPGTPFGGMADRRRLSSTNSPETHSWHAQCDSCLQNQSPGSQEFDQGGFATNTTVVLRQRFHNSIRTRNIESFWRPASQKGTTVPMPQSPSQTQATRPNPETVPEMVPGFPDLIPPLAPAQLPAQDVPYSEIPNIPDSQFHVTSYGPSTAADAPPVYHSGPPGEGTRERKVRVRGSGGVLRILNSVTEALDFIDALWLALPANLRTPYATPQQKLADLYTNINEIDVEQAITNVILEQVEDYAFGRASQIANTNQLNFREVPIGNLAGPAL